MKKLYLDPQNPYSVLNKSYLWHWWPLLKFDLIGRFGEFFLSKPPPQKESDPLLHLGCGGNYLKGFINADFYYYAFKFGKNKPQIDWLLDLRKPLNCPDNFWAGVFTEHTLEHLHPSDNYLLLKELFRTMKNGAYIRICVPGLMETIRAFQPDPDEAIIEYKNTLPYTTLAEAVWGLTQQWGHLSTFNAEFLTALLAEAGFSNCVEVAFKVGNNPKLIQDSPERHLGSLYVEAQKIISY